MREADVNEQTPSPQAKQRRVAYLKLDDLPKVDPRRSVHKQRPYAPELEMTEQDIALFNDSLERCTATPGFLERFYETLTASSSEVAEKFTRTNFRKQTLLLKASLYAMIFAAWARPEGDVHLERIARLHSSKGLDIKPELYDLWLTCLLQTVHACDRRFDQEIERAWRRMLQPGIAFMKSRYETASSAQPSPS
jgi:hemoglobin-like flavoprotein